MDFNHWMLASVAATFAVAIAMRSRGRFSDPRRARALLVLTLLVILDISLAQTAAKEVLAATHGDADAYLGSAVAVTFCALSCISRGEH